MRPPAGVPRFADDEALSDLPSARSSPIPDVRRLGAASQANRRRAIDCSTTSCRRAGLSGAQRSRRVISTASPRRGGPPSGHLCPSGRKVTLPIVGSLTSAVRFRPGLYDRVYAGMVKQPKRIGIRWRQSDEPYSVDRRSNRTNSRGRPSTDPSTASLAPSSETSSIEQSRRPRSVDRHPAATIPR
jgi:hypothetical protein